MITSLLSGKSSISFGPTSRPSGMSMWPSMRPMLVFLRIERPMSETRRSSVAAASTTCWTRWMFEAKQVTMMRPGQRANTSSQARAHARLRQRHAGPVRVRRVPAEQQQPLAAELGEPRDVGGHAVHRRLVELVVAGHQHRAELGGERDREGVRDRVRHLHHLDRERAGVEGLAGEHVLDRHVLQPVLVELRAHHRGGERASVDGRGAVELAQHERQRAHVVLVPVGEHDRVDVLGALAQVGEVRQHQVDPELVRRGEHQAGVHHHDAAVVLDDHHVLPDLPEPAQRQDPESARAQTAASRLWRSSASRITARSSSEASTSGRRSPPTSWPDHVHRGLDRDRVRGHGQRLVEVAQAVLDLMAAVGLVDDPTHLACRPGARPRGCRRCRPCP